MKKFILLFGTIVIIVITTQCNKSDSNQVKQLSINYPSVGRWGDNVLCIKDSSMIDPFKDFSFTANLQADAQLKIIMTNLSIAEKAGWFFDINSNDGWNITVYDNGSHQQIFTSRKAGVLDLDMTFLGPGKCNIDIYENNSITITKSIFLRWN